MKAGHRSGFIPVARMGPVFPGRNRERGTSGGNRALQIFRFAGFLVIIPEEGTAIALARIAPFRVGVLGSEATGQLGIESGRTLDLLRKQQVVENVDAQLSPSLVVGDAIQYQIGHRRLHRGKIVLGILRGKWVVKGERFASAGQEGFEIPPELPRKHLLGDELHGTGAGLNVARIAGD
jgi:hypothetical protein